MNYLVTIPSLWDYSFSVLRQTYHAHEMLKYSTYDHLRIK